MFGKISREYECFKAHMASLSGWLSVSLDPRASSADAGRELKKVGGWGIKSFRNKPGEPTREDTFSSAVARVCPLHWASGVLCFFVVVCALSGTSMWVPGKGPGNHTST